MEKGSFNTTDTGVAAGAEAVQAAVEDRYLVVRHISGYTDADSLIQILDEDDTVLWETRVEQDVTGEGFAINIPDGVQAPISKGIKGKVVTSTAACRVNISGYTRN